MPMTIPARVMETLQGFHGSAVLNAAIQLGVFAPLAAGPKSPAQVAKACRSSERGIAVLLDALAALGFLEKDAKRFRLNELSANHLVPESDGYVGEVARIVCDPLLWGAMGNFSQAVKHGGSVLAQHAETPNHRFWDTFAVSSRAFAIPAAEYIAGILGRFLEEREQPRVLDLACGSGHYGLTLARRLPGVEVTLFDRPSVLAAARRHAKELAMSKRVAFMPGDIFRADLHGPYDAVIASHVFHHFNFDACARLMRRLGKAVRPGGRVIIHDFVSDESRISNVPAALFAALMLVWTKEGTTYTYSEYKRLFAKGGFLAPVLHAPPHLATQFLVGERRRKRRR